MGRTSPEQKIRNAIEYTQDNEIPKAVLKAYRDHFNNSKRRGVPFELSLEQWWNWWKTDDRWSMRGVGVGRFVMARRGDVGPYSLDNIYLATHSQNIVNTDRTSTIAANKELWINKSAEERADWHLSIRGDGHPKSRAVLTPMGRFSNAALAGEAHGMTRQSAARKARDGLNGWRYEGVE